MNGRKVVVTGDAGSIVSNFIRALVKGNEVIVIDDLSAGNQKPPRINRQPKHYLR